MDDGCQLKGKAIGPHEHSQEPLENVVKQLETDLRNHIDLLEAIIDLGSLLGLWTTDAIRISIENVMEHKIKYPSLEGEELFAKRDMALKRKLVAFVKSEESKQR